MGPRRMSRCRSRCRSARAAWTRIRPRERRGRTAWRWQPDGASFLLLGLPAEEGLGVALEIVGQHTERPRGEDHLLQVVAEVLLDRRFLSDERRVCVREHSIGGGYRAARLIEGGREHADELGIDAAQELAGVFQRLPERRQILLGVLAMLF